MNYEQILELVKQHMPLIGQYILMSLGTLLVLGRAYIKITPTQDDDQWLQKMEDKPVIGALLNLLAYFSPVKRKEDPDLVPKSEEPK